MRKYTFELVVLEGNDEFWESIEDGSGCDEVEAKIAEALEARGFVNHDNCSLTLRKFENAGEG